MSNTTHYENANFLRELAESLPAYCRKVARTKLRCCSDWLTKKLAQAEYEDQVRAKVTAPVLTRVRV